MVSLPKILAISGCMMVQAGTMLDKLKATQVPQGHKEQLDLQVPPVRQVFKAKLVQLAQAV
jgi:hypothetical protein